MLKLTILLVLFQFLPQICFSGQNENVNPSSLAIVSTYECAGIYWETPEKGACKIRYKKVGTNSWKEGLELIYDSLDGEYRGSIINLSPNTKYHIEVSNSSAKAQSIFQTRNENFPIGKTTYLPANESDETIVITESGTPDGYHLITVPVKSKSVINLKNVHDYGIIIDANYVIVRGVEIRNAAIHGIKIKENRHDIVIEQCHITFWGRIGGPVTYGNFEGGSDSAIYADEGTQNITVQRNLIEDPRGGANDWTKGHPSGPQGISINQSKGGNVIRFNNIVSTEGHGFNDAIGGSSNFSNAGNMNRDSDIYGNIIRSVWDDAIESEGANMNVRIWGNYIHLYFIAIATASTSKGPIYIFRNVLGESRIGVENGRGGTIFKTGENELFGGGRRYVFHNTVLQPDGNGAFNVFSGHVSPNIITRNNIFDVPGRLATSREKAPAGDYDYDYFSGTQLGIAKEKNGIRSSFTPAGARLYNSSYSLEFYPRSTVNSIKWGKVPYSFEDKKVILTDPVVQIKNPLIDAGVIIPGFNDEFKGDAPDLGAFETGLPPLQFGRRAYLSYNEGWAPWEKY